MHHPTDRITHTTAFVTPVVEHWLEREIAQWVHPMKDCKTTHRTMSERSTSELRPAPQNEKERRRQLSYIHDAGNFSKTSEHSSIRVYVLGAE